MAFKIRLKRGIKSNLPTLSDGEPAFTTDEKELYIGSSSGNVKLTRNSEVSNLTSKSHTHSNKSIIDTITSTLISNWNSAFSHISDTTKHITSSERTLWNTVSSKANSSHTHDDRYYTESEANSKFVTKSELGTAGYGDMMKSVYDTNGNGIVDKAASVEWSGITNKPSSFNPASHTHNSIEYIDLSSKTISLNTITLSSGSPKLVYYYCPTDSVGSNITGRPNDSNKNAFNLKVELIRWASTTDYISKQTYIRGMRLAVAGALPVDGGLVPGNRVGSSGSSAEGFAMREFTVRRAGWVATRVIDPNEL